MTTTLLNEMKLIEQNVNAKLKALAEGSNDLNTILNDIIKDLNARKNDPKNEKLKIYLNHASNNVNHLFDNDQNDQIDFTKPIFNGDIHIETTLDDIIAKNKKIKKGSSTAPAQKPTVPRAASNKASALSLLLQNTEAKSATRQTQSIGATSSQSIQRSPNVSLPDLSRLSLTPPTPPAVFTPTPTNELKPSRLHQTFIFLKKNSALTDSNIIVFTITTMARPASLDYIYINAYDKKNVKFTFATKQVIDTSHDGAVRVMGKCTEVCDIRCGLFLIKKQNSATNLAIWIEDRRKR